MLLTVGMVSTAEVHGLRRYLYTSWHFCIPTTRFHGALQKLDTYTAHTNPSHTQISGRLTTDGSLCWPYRTVAVTGPHLEVERAPRSSLFTFGTGNRPGKRPI